MLDFLALGGGEGQQGQAWVAAVVAIEVGGVLDGGNAQLACNADAGGFDALLLLGGELVVAVLKGRVNFIAGGGRAGGNATSPCTPE